MNMMSNTVVKEQQEALKGEEQKIIEHYRRRDQREKDEDAIKKQKYKVQQQQVREFLNQQVQEKNEKKVFERELNHRQASFWKNDTQDYQNKETAKENYIKEVNLKHQDILRQQINEKHSKGRKAPPPLFRQEQDEPDGVAPEQGRPQEHRCQRGVGQPPPPGDRSAPDQDLTCYKHLIPILVYLL